MERRVDAATCSTGDRQLEADMRLLPVELERCVHPQTKAVIDKTGVENVISKLELVAVTEQYLQATRLGALVNAVRKCNEATHPDLSRRMRGLIKSWKAVLSRSASPAGASSGGSTPVLPMYAGRPRTVTPSYAPPAAAASHPRTPNAAAYANTAALQNQRPLHKSASAVSGLCNQNGDGAAAPPDDGPPHASAFGTGSGLRVRIKYGGPEGAVVHTCAASPVQGSEQAANRRKRKAGPDVPTRSPSASGAGLVNGLDPAVATSSNLATTVVMSDDAPLSALVHGANGAPNATVSPVHNGKSAGGFEPLAKRQRGTHSPSPSSPRPPTPSGGFRRAKLKTTAELVAEMNADYPEEMQVAVAGSSRSNADPNRRGHARSSSGAPGEPPPKRHRNPPKVSTGEPAPSARATKPAPPATRQQHEDAADFRPADTAVFSAFDRVSQRSPPRVDWTQPAAAAAGGGAAAAVASLSSTARFAWTEPNTAADAATTYHSLESVSIGGPNGYRPVLYRSALLADARSLTRFVAPIGGAAASTAAAAEHPSTRRRLVAALPMADAGRPDFIEYGLPNRDSYIHVPHWRAAQR